MTSTTDARASAYARGPRPEPLYIEAPALASPGWIPEDTDWLDELRADHARLIEQVSETAAEESGVRARFDAEDAEYQDAIRQGFRDGAEVEAPPLTPPEERRGAIEEAQLNTRLASEALDDFLRDAIAEIEQGAPGWLGELSEVHEQARAKREEAARLLAEATADVQQVGRLEEWLKRASGTHERGAFRLTANRYVAWDHLCETYNPVEPPDPDAGAVLVDTHDPETFAESLDRGTARPFGEPDARTEAEVLADAVGVQPDDPARAEERRGRIEEFAEGVDSVQGGRS